MVDNNFDDIPDGERIKEQMKSEYTNDDNNGINGLIVVMKKRGKYHTFVMKI